jgi:hypothetical protein
MDLAFAQSEAAALERSPVEQAKLAQRLRAFCLHRWFSGVLAREHDKIGAPS